MAKGSVDLPLIPEVTMSSGIELRRHSAGIASSGNNEKKVVPHYLRASTGSCHDFCKYGRNRVEEAKEKLSMIKRAGRKPLSRSSEGSIGGTMTSVAKQKASVDSKPTKMSTMKHSESVDSEIRISRASDTNKLELPTKSFGSQKQIGNKVLVNTNKASLVRVKPSFLPKSHISSTPETRRGGISLSFEMEIPLKPTSKRVETSPIATSERVKTHRKSTSQMVETSSKSMSKMKGTSSKVSSLEDKEMELSEKHVTSLNPDFITMQTISSMNSSEGFGGQRNSKIKMIKREASSKPSCRNIASVSARKHKGLKIVPHLINQPEPTKLELEEHNNEAQEKTLYVIKMESANQTSLSDQNESQDIELPLSNSLSSPKFSPSSISKSSSQEDQEESEYATNEFEEDASSGKHEIKNMTNVDTLEAEENGKPQKDGTVCSEEKDCQKLGGKLAETQIESHDIELPLYNSLSSPNFSPSSISKSSSQEDQEESEYATSEFEEDASSGKHEIEYMTNVDTLEAEENGKPQKDGIVCSEDKNCQKLRGNLAETQIEKGSLRSLKLRRRKVLGNNATDVKAGAITGPEKVVLRHQDVQVKKDEQGLYNNVIEETASKLVETQKSKVKALVGAFETVISLEEKRTSANIVN